MEEESFQRLIPGGKIWTNGFVAQRSDEERNSKSETQGQLVVLFLNGDRRLLCVPEDLQISQEVWAPS